MTTLGKKQSQLLKDLEEVRNDMESLLEDETVVSLPKKYRSIKDNFDNILQNLEDGEYEEEPEEES